MNLTKTEAKERAVKAMENCCAYIAIGQIKNALMSYGEANAYGDILSEWGYYLYDEDEHFANMIEIAEDKFIQCKVIERR